MERQTRARAGENGSHRLRSGPAVGVVFLVFAAAVLLASCGTGAASNGGDETEGEIAFADFDSDQSGDVDETEFYEGVYDDWDANDSGIVEEDEFSAELETWYDDYDYSEYGDYEDWDADGNGELAQDEFDESVPDTGLYDEWDVDDDDLIEENEFNEAV